MRWIGRLAIIIVVLLMAGIAYEQWGRSRWIARHPRVGQAVDIGGRSLNLLCSGQGSLTVFFNGLGGTARDWEKIQKSISQHSRTCAWDRAGTGWSDPGPLPQTAKFNARDAHALLNAANVPPPYVLVGGSFGGFEARVFRGLWPGEVAGVVFVDASQEDEDNLIPLSLRAKVAPQWLRWPLLQTGRFMAATGILRLAGNEQPAATMARQSTGIYASENNRQVRAAGGLGDIPVIVLTAGIPFMDVPDAVAYHQVWMYELQPKLARLSTHRRQIIVQDSDHGIGFRRPDIVTSAITEVLGTNRSREVSNTHAGSP